MGKPVGNDLSQGIMTLPAIMAVERHPEDDLVPALFRGPGTEMASVQRCLWCRTRPLSRSRMR